jgi:hypothetical protein
MPIARVQMPDGRVARFEVAEGTSPADVEAAAGKLSAGETYQADLPQPPPNPANPFMHPGTPFTQTDLKVAQYVTPETVGATIGSLVAPGLGTEGMPLLMRALAYGAPKVLGAALGGGGGAAIKEAGNPNSTRESITNEGINGAIRQAGAEVAGLGVSAGLNRLYAPNIVPLKKLSEQVQERAAFIPGKVSEFIAGLPEGSTARNVGEGAINLAERFKEPAMHLFEAVDKVRSVGDAVGAHSLLPLIGGPATISLGVLHHLLHPGALMNYLTKEPASAMSQEILRQVVTSGFRGHMAPNGDDVPQFRQPSQPFPQPTREPQDDPFTHLATP